MVALAVFPERSQVSIRAKRRELGQSTGELFRSA